MNVQSPNSFRNGPDEEGQFGIFGGRFVAETLMPNILELDEAYAKAKKDPEFLSELEYLNKHYTGRPSPTQASKRKLMISSVIMSDAPRPFILPSASQNMQMALKSISNVMN